MFVVRYWPLDSPSQLLKPIEHGQLREHIDSEDDILRFFRKPLSGEEAMIEDVSEHQHGEIQSWKIVVNISDTAHNEEGGEVEEPPKKCNLSDVEEVIPFTRFHIDVFPLLPEQVNSEKEYAREQAESGSNPDQRRANEIILGLVISPTAHAKAKVLEWPIERCGCQDIVLVWVWNQSIV